MADDDSAVLAEIFEAFMDAQKDNVNAALGARYLCRTFFVCLFYAAPSANSPAKSSVLRY
jgi:hypothetical protein